MKSVSLALCICFAGLAAHAQLTAPEPWPLAVRLQSYGDYQDAAWRHLQNIGVRYVFLSVPAPEDVEALQKKLEAHDLTPLVFRGSADLTKASFADELEPQLATCKAMGVKYLFLSAKRHETSKAIACVRLRAAGQKAQQHGVTIVLETHPDLCTNGELQRETMEAVHHPNVRINFDTANITYYNRNTTALAELEKIVPYVATVELKDHTGNFEAWEFPPLGEGIVDFPAIFRRLRAHGFHGPVTIEFEGTKGIPLDRDETKGAIGRSVRYAREHAVFE